MTESPILRRILLALGARDSVRLFRNNVGVAVYPDGSRVVYGLAPGSPDLIGLTSITVTPDMIGRRLAVFTAIEVKAPRGRPTDAQRAFVAMVQRMGGIAGIARSPEEAAALLAAGPGQVSS
ncbi:VRR-NUC domain-containing protein [Azospirillum thermophilum]|uniref:VRR-NUC domain-containing protein n=1 Tax=Azospirillum thermophilum TaxID=2202148 RepID=A0A2S2CL58_9PROT|nr:VRR-NUC domain-containing protein [Azospirillum thermophilum]AWK85047.1 VRR-NUC domain-containing protein [Azospirillum thermophilum]